MCTMAIIGVTSVCSWMGFRDPAFRDRHLFSVPEILAEKEYHRLFTSAFLHADWNHLLLNMVSLFLFGRHIELFLGVKEFLVIYFAAILGGSALSLLIHRHHEYKAYGASGGVCGSSPSGSRFQKRNGTSTLRKSCDWRRAGYSTVCFKGCANG